MAKKAEKKTEQNHDHFESVCGILIAVFAAVLAIAGLGGGNTGKGQMVAQTEKGSAYEWYNSKSIKLNLAKGQADSLESMLKSGVIAKNHEKNIQNDIDRLKKSTDRYDASGMEILEGSNLTALKKIEIDAFDNEILPKIRNASDRDFVKGFYEKDKDGKFYVLKKTPEYGTINDMFDIMVTRTGYKSPRWVQDLNGSYGVITGANEWEERARKIADADGLFDMANLFLQLCLVLGAISIVLKKSGIKKVMFVSMIAIGIIGAIYTIIGFIASSGLGV